MKKASIRLYFVIWSLLSCYWISSSEKEGECRKPARVGMLEEDWGMTIDLAGPEQGFERILTGELDMSFGERLSFWRHFDMLSYNRDLPNFASREIRSAIRDTVTESLKEFFVVDPETGLSFMYAVGRLIQDNDFTTHSIDFGIRRIIDDPYVFIGHDFAVDDEEVLSLQIRACFRNWHYVIPEFAIIVPVSSWTITTGLRYEVGGSPNFSVMNIEDSYYHNGSLNGGLSYFFGLQGRLLGGQAFLGTGYPEAMTILYQRSF